MARNTACTIFIGNLDEKVTERVLYEILIQAGYLVDLHIPRDKESKNHKGYAFAEYETEEVAYYAIRLFSGLVRLHNKNLRFAMSGQDKSSNNSASPATKKINSGNCAEESPHSTIIRKDAVDNQMTDPTRHYSARSSAARGLGNSSFEYSRRVIGSMLNGVVHNGSGNSIAHPSY